MMERLLGVQEIWVCFPSLPGMSPEQVPLDKVPNWKTMKHERPLVIAQLRPASDP